MTNDITPHDEVSRLTFRPRDFPQAKYGCLDLSQSMVFSEDSKRCESVNCHRLVNRYPEELHIQGVRIQTQKNEDNAKLGKATSYEYAGFVASLVEKVEIVSEAGHFFKVMHCPENDNDAHCHIQMQMNGVSYSKSVAKVIKNRLTTVFGELQIPS
jgi:hypothetical protein